MLLVISLVVVYNLTQHIVVCNHLKS